MSIEEIKYRINELKNFDYSNFDNFKYKYLLKKMGELCDNELELLVPIYSTKGIQIFRCRKNEGNKPYNYNKDLWHPPANKTPPGRLNFSGKPLLYTAHNAATAMIEIDASNCKYFTTAEYKIIPDKLRTIELGLRSITEQERSIQNPKEKLIMEFLGNEAKKIVPENRFWLYCITMIYATSIGDNSIFDAYTYESVAANQKGLNIAFKPIWAKTNLKPIEYRMCKVLSSSNRNEFHIQCLKRSKIIGKGLDGKIIWEEVDDCHKGHFIDSNTFNYHNTK